MRSLKLGSVARSMILLLSMVASQPALAQSDPNSSGQLAQSLSGPQLDQSLSDLKANFTRIEAVGVPDLATSSPAYTIAVPTGYGVAAGTFYLVAGGATEQRRSSNGQAGVGAGFGLGDPNRLVGLEVNYVVADLDKGTGGFSLKVHRNLVSNTQVGWSIAVGWEDFTTTGTPLRSSSVYGSTSVILKLSPDINNTFSRLALTGGIGGGRFRSDDDITQGRNSIGVFGSAALRVTRSISVIGEWTGQDLAAGVSIAPFPDINFYITPAVRDLAGPTSSKARFSLSTGLSFQF